jgi:hypothetical protein
MYKICDFHCFFRDFEIQRISFSSGTYFRETIAPSAVARCAGPFRRIHRVLFFASEGIGRLVVTSLYSCYSLVGCARLLMSLTSIVWFRTFTNHWKRVEHAKAWGTDAHRQSFIKDLQNVCFRGKVGPRAEDQNFKRFAGTTVFFCITISFILLLLLIVTKDHTLSFRACSRHPSLWLHHILSASLGIVIGMQMRAVYSI